MEMNQVPPSTTSDSTQNKRIIAAVSYALFFVPLLTKEKNDPFVRHHMKQAIRLLIVVLAVQGIISIAGYWQFTFGLPFLYFPRMAAVWALRIFFIVMILIGAKNAWENSTKDLPWIGEYLARL